MGPLKQPPFSTAALTLMHDDDDFPLEGFGTQSIVEVEHTPTPTPTVPTTYFTPIPFQPQQLPLATGDGPVTSAAAAATTTIHHHAAFQATGKPRPHQHHHHHHQHLSLEQVPTPSIAKDIRSRVSPYLLFRPVLALQSPQSFLPTDPWCVMPEDRTLDHMWTVGSSEGSHAKDHMPVAKSQGKFHAQKVERVAARLRNCPSTGYLAHTLKAARRQQRSKSLAGIDGGKTDPDKATITEARTEKFVSQTRKRIEQQLGSVIKDIDELRGREVSDVY